MEKGDLEVVRIKRIGVVSLANLFGVLYIISGLIFGIFFTLLASLIPPEFNVSGAGFSFGYFGLIIFPVVGGIIGWFSGAITALLYNLASKITKGVALYS